MAGQWIGILHGHSDVIALVDLDDHPSGLVGHAYLYDMNPDLLAHYVDLSIPRRSGRQTMQLGPQHIAPLHPQRFTPVLRDTLATAWPNQIYPRTAEIAFEFLADGNLQGGSVTFDDATPPNTLSVGRGILDRSQADQPSPYHPDPKVNSWAAFKVHASGLSPSTCIFRGQSSPVRLRTVFHRTPRKDLVSYIEDDVPELHRYLTPRMAHLLTLSNPEHYASFLHLAQHHGFPTPLLDWTYSPFVAAFFAYKNFLGFDSKYSVVRVLQFDVDEWANDHVRIDRLSYAKPHFSVLEPVFIGNDRAVPQQSVSMVTNLDDIEDFIRHEDGVFKKKYMKVFDLPRREAKMVMRELRLMGINAGSMFPGLAGACEDMKSRLFDLL